MLPITTRRQRNNSPTLKTTTATTTTGIRLTPAQPLVKTIITTTIIPLEIEVMGLCHHRRRPRNNSNIIIITIINCSSRTPPRAVERPLSRRRRRGWRDAVLEGVLEAASAVEAVWPLPLT